VIEQTAWDFSVNSRAEAPKLITLQGIPDARGILCVAEASRHTGFSFQRFYFITEVLDDAIRGSHAHKTLRQCFICLRGAVTVELQGKAGHFTFRLDNFKKALVVPPGYWRVLRDFSDDVLFGVLASHEYSEVDYIRDYDEFCRFQAGFADDSIPYLDLTRYANVIGIEMQRAISEVVRAGTYIGGPTVAKFEKEIASFCGTNSAIGVGNGLDALSMSLRAWGIGPGDEVIVPANTFIATALAVTQVGATLVLADVEENTGLIDPISVSRVMTKNSRAIIPVHLFGHPADMDKLRELVDGTGIYLLEDACQAHGAKYKGRRCGALGDAAAFSFYPTKNLGALGDGGMVTTNDRKLSEALRRLGNYGSETKYKHDTIGFNSRLDPVQAAVLSLKLMHLEEWNTRRRELAKRYMRSLAGIDALRLPEMRSWAEPVWHVFAVRVQGDDRDALQRSLQEAGIGSNVHYRIPVHLQRCYAGNGWSEGSFPVAERNARQLLSLPLDPMHTDSEIDRVIDVVLDFFKKA
jgi:dTDP-4-amino-4,6-dideoxygalactose transaminase